jgi:predicted glutamine amidotransferase
MHNGYIPGFEMIKRRLRQGLSDPYYNMIAGTTDSETAFALFLENLGEAINNYSVRNLRHAMEATIQQIIYLQREAGIEESSYLNFVVCDGKRIVASRFASDNQLTPQTLYYSMGEKFELTDDIYRMVNSMASNKSIVIASEPLTSHRQDWQLVEPNHIIQISSKNQLTHWPIVC